MIKDIKGYNRPQGSSSTVIETTREQFIHKTNLIDGYSQEGDKAGVSLSIKGRPVLYLEQLKFFVQWAEKLDKMNAHLSELSGVLTEIANPLGMTQVVATGSPAIASTALTSACASSQTAITEIIAASNELKAVLP